jgi:hypothetical protein
MNKFIFGAFVLGMAAFNVAHAEDISEDEYDKAYSICSEKADLVEGDYEKIFTSCMKSKGIGETEDDSAPKKDEARKPAAVAKKPVKK